MFEFDDRPAGERFRDVLRRSGRHRRAWWIGGAVILLCLVGAALWDGPARGVDTYRVRNGDTLLWTPRTCLLAKLGLACQPRRLRLFGVDAFEPNQTCERADGKVWPCGKAASRRLSELVAEPGFSCRFDPAERRHHEFAQCRVKDRDVGALLVGEGLAFYYGRGLQYLPIEARARATKRGAWAGKFIRPQFWRQGARL
ncbi:MAG: thermonuclease family protein [Stellaceae bacterium]